jgi:hypothetical protein
VTERTRRAVDGKIGDDRLARDAAECPAGVINPLEHHQDGVTHHPARSAAARRAHARCEPARRRCRTAPPRRTDSAGHPTVAASMSPRVVKQSVRARPRSPIHRTPRLRPGPDTRRSARR